VGGFSRFIRFEVGDGSKIRFWLDVWCALFSIACFKDASVANHVQFSIDIL